MTDPREVEALQFVEAWEAVERALTEDVVVWTPGGHKNVAAIARRLATALRALVAENAELRARIDEEHDTDETLLAALITATLCRLPVEVVGDGDWERYREEHGKRWMGDHRAFGGWLSGRITDALKTLTAQLAAARADTERLMGVIRGAANAGVQFDDSRLHWVDLQMDRGDWQALVDAANGGT